jgi:hypothetical protein
MAENRNIVATACHDHESEEPASAMLDQPAYPESVAS